MANERHAVPHPITPCSDVHPSNRLIGASLPIFMSLVALLAVARAVVNFKKYGPPLGEDGPWHLFMLTMFLQLPIILYFIFNVGASYAARRLPGGRRQGRQVPAGVGVTDRLGNISHRLRLCSHPAQRVVLPAHGMGTVRGAC
jgi:hypothetical protein